MDIASGLRRSPFAFLAIVSLSCSAPNVGHVTTPPSRTSTTRMIDTVDLHHGTSPKDQRLFEAIVSRSDRDAIDAVVQGANVNARDARNSTPLYYASMAGHRQLVEALVKAGANVNTRCFAGLTPLHKACEGGHPEVVEYLLANHADPRIIDNSGYTPLHLAVMGTEPNSENIVDLLLDHNANINAVTHDGETPLDIAEHEGPAYEAESIIRDSVIRELLARDAKHGIRYDGKRG